MAMHPRVLKKAQAELDAVVGPDRLPDFSDQESLVYVNAVVKELLRWHPVLPLGIPHCTMEDDSLDGYFVPAGTVILTNVWCVWTARWMHHVVTAMTYWFPKCYIQGVYARSRDVRRAGGVST